MGYHQGKIFGDTSLFSSLELRPKGRYALPVKYGLYIWLTGTHYPYIRPVYMGHMYGCQKCARMGLIYG